MLRCTSVRGLRYLSRVRFNSSTTSPNVQDKEEHIDPSETYLMYTDGASRGNPGLAGSGSVIANREGRVLKKVSVYLGTVTNNVAEYYGVIHGLNAAKELGIQKLLICLDSELLCRQFKGEYRVKHPDLVPLMQRIRDAEPHFQSIQMQHVYREDNAAADALANQAIDDYLNDLIQKN
eukprot:GILJ01005765.1.p1 GENE.GILJ01005765.1~~GILJ01005765.1.p1  ORF type:complete len:178 (-),score=9.73 GILJ01005765.1:179-712(-)